MLRIPVGLLLGLALASGQVHADPATLTALRNSGIRLTEEQARLIAEADAESLPAVIASVAASAAPEEAPVITAIAVCTVPEVAEEIAQAVIKALPQQADAIQAELALGCGGGTLAPPYGNSPFGTPRAGGDQPPVEPEPPVSPN